MQKEKKKGETGMKVGIILYSKSGNTLTVAQRLQSLLLEQGHIAEIARIETEEPEATPPVIKVSPDPKGYDALIFAAPVHAFSLSLVMKNYLASMPIVQGKKVNCFVTQHFPKAWMGGNRAVGQLKRSLTQKGALVIHCAVINWSSSKKAEQIEGAVKKMVQF